MENFVITILQTILFWLFTDSTLDPPESLDEKVFSIVQRNHSKIQSNPNGCSDSETFCNRVSDYYLLKSN